MGIETWTDKDYVQAALDMLPDDVGEVGRFLRQQGVRESKVTRDICATCPIAQWVNKWSDELAYVGFRSVCGIRTDWHLKLPLSAREFIGEWHRDRGDVLA